MSEEREAPRCATCFGRGTVCRYCGSGNDTMARAFRCASCRATIDPIRESPCPACREDCAPRSETDGGLLGALDRIVLRAGDPLAVYGGYESDAALLSELRERLQAWRAETGRIKGLDDPPDYVADRALLKWLGGNL